MVLVDKSGEIDARVFDKVEELEPAFSTGDFVLVRGNVIAFHGKPQVVIEAVEKLDAGPLDPQEFEPPAAPPDAVPAADRLRPAYVAPRLPSPAARRLTRLTGRGLAAVGAAVMVVGGLLFFVAVPAIARRCGCIRNRAD